LFGFEFLGDDEDEGEEEESDGGEPGGVFFIQAKERYISAAAIYRDEGDKYRG
jgi:hypothetical protein